jgi:hypothetical protein
MIVQVRLSGKAVMILQVRLSVKAEAWGRRSFFFRH